MRATRDVLGQYGHRGARLAKRIICRSPERLLLLNDNGTKKKVLERLRELAAF
jgi:hypothetical protein